MRPVLVVGGMVFVVFLAHLYIMPPMNYYSIMDEHYYIFVAQQILSRTVCLPQTLQLPYSCNYEHPPLAKVLVALGIGALSDAGYGWRISSILTGTLSIPLLYAVANKLSDDRRLSLLAAGFLGLDTLFFTQSSVAMLDVPEVFFALCAFAVYLYGMKLGPFNSKILSGMILGLSILSKETGIFLLAALVTYHAFFVGGSVRTRTRDAAEFVLAAFAIFALGLQIYDSLYSPYPIFVDQIEYILRFGSSFRSSSPLPILSILSNRGLAYNFVIQAQGCMSCARSGPFDWVTLYYPVDFLSLPSQNFNFEIIADVPIVWALYAWIPLGVRSLRRSAGTLGGTETRLVGFALIWFLWNYLPYVVLYAFGRYMFLWYLIPAVPALSLGAAYLVTRTWFPRWGLLLYVAVVVVWFLAFFPVK